MTVREITDLLPNETTIILEDRLSDEGVVYEGKLLFMRTFWDDREVKFMIPFSNLTIKLEIE